METNTQEMNKTRSKIIEYLANEFDIPPFDLNKTFFKSDGTMALSEVGHRVMSKTFNFHQFRIKGQLLTKHYLGLRHLDYPYYLSESWLILYNAEDTTLLELYGSADDFLEAYANGV